MTRLRGRVALVTGALNGIGLACAERLLAEGAHVVLTDLAPTADATLARLGPAASYLRLDVADEADWAAAAVCVRTDHARLDILVANAGVDLTGAVETLDLGAWRRIMAINVDGVFLAVRALTPLMAETGATTPAGSSIVTMSSILGLVGFADTSAYNAGKGAVRLFTKAVAIEFAGKRTPIRVNSVHPGFVRTPLLTTGMANMVAQGKAERAEDLIDAVAAATPMGRVAEPAEIAAVVAFLASDDASYMTGSELVVDGGWTAR